MQQSMESIVNQVLQSQMTEQLASKHYERNDDESIAMGRIPISSPPLLAS